MTSRELVHLAIKFGFCWAMFRQWGDNEWRKMVEELAEQLDMELEEDNEIG